MHNPFRKPSPPTPLEEATAAYVRTQHALIKAYAQAEDGAAEVRLYTERRVRLRQQIVDLSQEEGPLP